MLSIPPTNLCRSVRGVSEAKLPVFAGPTIQRPARSCAAAVPPKLRQNAADPFMYAFEPIRIMSALTPFSANQPLPPRLPARWRSSVSCWPCSGTVPETCTDLALLVAASAAATIASADFEATPFDFLVDPPQPAHAASSNASNAIRPRFRERMRAFSHFYSNQVDSIGVTLYLVGRVSRGAI